MSIGSVVLEIRSGAAERVLARLALMPKTSVYGVTDNHIVTVIESDGANTFETILKEVGAMEGVTGVYPVLVEDM